MAPKEKKAATATAPAKAPELTYVDRTRRSIVIHCQRRNLDPAKVKVGGKEITVEAVLLAHVKAQDHKWPNLEARTLDDLNEPQLKLLNRDLPPVLQALCGGLKRAAVSRGSKATGGVATA